MHQIILQTGRSNLGDDEIQSYKLKMIANAAGGLLPSLAYEMQRTFAAAAHFDREIGAGGHGRRAN